MSGRIVLLDREREVRYSYPAVVRLSREHGINLFKINEVTIDDPHTLAVLLWAGLLHEEPDLTLERTMEMMTLRGVPAILEAVGVALTDELGDTPDPLSETPAESSTDITA